MVDETSRRRKEAARRGPRSGPGSSPARQLAFTIGLIADTTEWPHADYQALTARLLAPGTPVLELTLGQVVDAITTTATASGAGGADTREAQ